MCKSVVDVCVCVCMCVNLLQQSGLVCGCMFFFFSVLHFWCCWIVVSVLKFFPLLLGCCQVLPFILVAVLVPFCAFIFGCVLHFLCLHFWSLWYLFCTFFWSLCGAFLSTFCAFIFGRCVCRFCAFWLQCARKVLVCG